MKNLANIGQKFRRLWGHLWQPLASWLTRLWTFIQRHTLPVFFILSILATTFFYYDVVFFSKTLLSPGGLTAGVMGDAGAYGDNLNQLPPDFTKFAVFLKDLGSNAWTGEPQVAKAASAIRHWDFPLWNDNMGVGVPLAANFLSSAFYPLKLILYLLPNVQGWDIYLLARFSLGIFFLFLFLRELGLRRLPAFLSGMAFAFSGFFVLLQNIQDIDVELSTPIIFWIVALAMNLARKNKVHWYTYCLLVGGLVTVFLTNIPEPLLLVLAAGFIYWGYRLVVLFKKERAQFKSALFMALKIITPSLLIILPLYLLNIEFIANAVSTHGASLHIGSSIYTQPKYAILNVFPYLNGSFMFYPSSPTLGIVLNYIGFAGFLLVLLGVVEAIRQKGSRLFILILGLITIAKIYGVPVINEVIGETPGFDRILYIKYAQALVSFSAASLIGFGLEGLLLRTIKRWHLWVVLLGGGALIWYGLYKLPEFPLTHINLGVLAVYGVVLVILSLVLTMPIELKTRSLWVAALGVTVLVELWIFIPRTGRPFRYETFTKPPFVSFLQHQEKPFRIYAYDGLLYPDLSSGFDLDDVRNLDGLLVSGYQSYIRQFISHSVQDRFTGHRSGPGESLPATIINNPFMDVLNVQYIISSKPALDLLPTNDFNDWILKLNQPTPSLREVPFDIDGDVRRVLFEHAPTTACAPFPVTTDKYIFRFAIAIDPIAWENKDSDGVQFIIYSTSGTELYHRFINPTHVQQDRGWFEEQIDLSAYVDQNQTICLQTKPRGNNASDWAGWADLRLTGAEDKFDDQEKVSQAYSLVYAGKDAFVYKNNQAMPRAFAVGQVTSVGSTDAAIKYMKKADFNPRTAAVVIPRRGQPTLPEFNPTDCSAGTFENYNRPKSSLATFEFTSSGTCFLVWSETDYPGWVATVDGEPTSIYSTDILLRGLVVGPGKHQIVMRYRPITFYGGLIGTLAGLLLTAFWAIRFSQLAKSTKVG